MWALKQRAIYILILLVILLILFGLPIYRSLNKAPTCSDGKKNGTELGVDCGGSCSRACSSETEDPIVLWSRSLKVKDGYYSSVAMIENPNIGVEALNVPYVFRLFDENNILVYERKGRIDIAPQTRFPVFEVAIFTGERIPKRTFFEFVGDITWFSSQKKVSDIIVSEQRLVEGETPRIEALIQNKSAIKVEGLEVFALVYNKDGTAIAASSTFIDRLEADQSKSVVFTWPENFIEKPSRIEILPKVSGAK